MILANSNFSDPFHDGSIHMRCLQLSRFFLRLHASHTSSTLTEAKIGSAVPGWFRLINRSKKLY